MANQLTHFDSEGRARMVEVTGKDATARVAIAQGRIRMRAETLALALSGDAKKGDARAVAEVAGVMAAKKTADLIPLCHPLPLTGVQIAVADDSELPGFVVTARVTTLGQTGVEMEALTAVSVALLTLYDMLKAADKAMTIEAVALLEKSGGASGDFRRAP